MTLDNLTLNQYKIERKLEDVSELFTRTTEINSKVFNDKGELIYSTLFDNKMNFCNLVRNSGFGKKNCDNRRLHVKMQSSKIGGIYPYFCPFGFPNWLAAIYKNGKISYFITAGPVRTRSLNSMVKNIFKKNQQLRSYVLTPTLKEYLQEIKYVEEERIDFLTKLFELLVDSVNVYNSSSKINEKEDESKDLNFTTPGNKLIINKAANYIRENLEKELKLEDVAKKVGYSQSYFSRIFKIETGYSFTKYFNMLRIQKSIELLKEYDNLTEVAFLVGYKDQSHFCKIFKNITGVSPGRYKKALDKNKMESIFTNC